MPLDERDLGSRPERQRPSITGFAPPWLRGITIKAGAEPFDIRPPITETAVGGVLQELARSRFDIDEPIAGYRLRDTAPIPSAADREAYFGDDDAAYWLSGLSDALRVARAASRFGISGERARYFELGCASGRVVRHVAFQSAHPIYCCDINKRHTEWVRLFLPERINVFHTTVLPTLPLEDNSIDVAAAFSVFTHIDDFETAWLLELRRVLRPGGIAYLTIQSENTWERYKQDWIKSQYMPIADRITEFAIDEHFFRGSLPRERTVIWWPTDDNIYNAAVFHRTSYITREWGRAFTVLDIIQNGHFYQDVVILMK